MITVMIESLISGKLIKAAELKTSQNGKHYTNILLTVSTDGDNAKPKSTEPFYNAPVSF